MQQLLRIPAPAKLNLFLHIVGRRPDGYHLLQSVFTFIDLYDYLDIQLRTDGRIERTAETLVGLAPENDLIVRAALLLQQQTGTHFGATISCEKNIPAGAGLGGGSSNAASTLIALNKLWGTGLNRQQLMDLGLQLGADVPVFIFGCNAFAEGVGEQLQAVDLPQYHYVLLKPEAVVATSDIFSDKDLTRNSKPVIITDFTDYQTKADPHFMGSVDLFGHNVLESVACKYAAEIEHLLQLLRNKKLHARMTGSGSSLFVSFLNKETATRQASDICSTLLIEQPTMRTQPNVWVVSGLKTHPLYNWLTEFGD